MENSQMATVKMTLLTDLHIGSGDFSQPNTEYFFYKEDGYETIGVIDDKKILDIIGVERLQDWLLSIERKENILEFLRRYKKEVTARDFCKRTITCYADGPEKCQNLKETMINGAGRPYVPGSSIKGAIRTAILATIANGEEWIKKASLESIKGFEKDQFGSNTESWLFRQLQVGDCYFEQDDLASLIAQSLNQREKNSYYDSSKKQLIEVLSMDSESEFRLKIVESTGLKKIKEMASFSTLFQTINSHTLLLIEKEINWWTKLIDNDSSNYTEQYLHELHEIKTKIKACKDERSCVLRIGYGSGWRFMTGGWTERMEKFEEEIVPKSRPRNDKYSEYPFPKSRRVIGGSASLLGFVKLTF